MKKIIIIGLILLLTACGEKYSVIDANTAKSMIEDGAVLIDVRTIEEYAKDHIAGSVNIPLSEIETTKYNIDDKIIL